MRESIDAFVIGVAERVDRLQDAEADSDWEQLATLSKNLVEDANLVGFVPLSRCADLIAAACQEGERGSIRERLTDLTSISRRIRQGHRGSV